VDAPEDGTVSGKADKEKRRWRKRKSRDHDEPVRQAPAEGLQAGLGETHQPRTYISRAAPLLRPTTRARNPELNLRDNAPLAGAQSKSDPTGQGPSQTDGAREMDQHLPAHRAVNQ
jgi:hypothetical protein